MSKKTEKPKGPKQYHMTQEEQTNLAGRDGMRGQYEYLAKLLERDMGNYIDVVVKKRLGIPKEALVKYDIDQGVLYVIEPPKIKVEPVKEENGQKPTE